MLRYWFHPEDLPVTPAALADDEDGSWVLGLARLLPAFALSAAISSAAVAMPLTAHQDEAPIAGAVVVADEDAVWPAIVWPAHRTPQAFTADEVLGFLTVDEDGWIPRAPISAPAWTPLNVSVQDDLPAVPTFVAEEDGWRPVVRWPVAPVLGLLGADETWPTPAPPLTVDEESYLPWVQWFWGTAPQPFACDEALAVLTHVTSPRLRAPGEVDRSLAPAARERQRRPVREDSTREPEEL